VLLQMIASDHALQVNETADGGFSISINFCSTLCTSVFQVPPSGGCCTMLPVSCWQLQLPDHFRPTDMQPQATIGALHMPPAMLIRLIRQAAFWLATVAIPLPSAGVLHPGAPLLVQVLRAAGLHRGHGAAGWAPLDLIEMDFCASLYL
jgi:hypothetical protein